MRRINGLLLIAFVGACLAMLEIAGCGPRDQARPRPRTESPPTTQLIAERPIDIQAQPTLIKQGKAPLVYLAQGEGTLKFVDQTANGNELARAFVGHRQIVRIDATRGVMLGETVLRAGPLPADHTYGIWLEPDASNYSRNTIVNPQPGRDTSPFDPKK